MKETQDVDYKSLRVLTRSSPGWKELAGDCVCFANARGGRIIVGIEDKRSEPPPGQLIPPGLTEKVHR